jgi:hypothetical protein
MSNWAIGFTMGLLVVLAYQKIYDEPVIIEAARAEELINVYKRGQADALRTNPVSMELEQACLNIWASKQPVEK